MKKKKKVHLLITVCNFQSPQNCVKRFFNLYEITQQKCSVVKNFQVTHQQNFVSKEVFFKVRFNQPLLQPFSLFFQTPQPFSYSPFPAKP